MFPGCLQDISRMFSECSDGFYWPGGIWWAFQMKVWTLMVQRNPMIPNYSMTPAIRWFPGFQWSPGIRWSPAIRWSIRSMDFDNSKVYGDTFISDGLVFLQHWSNFPSLFSVDQKFPFVVELFFSSFFSETDTTSTFDPLGVLLNSKYFIYPNVFLRFLLSSSSPPLTNYCSSQPIPHICHRHHRHVCVK